MPDDDAELLRLLDQIDEPVAESFDRWWHASNTTAGPLPSEIEAEAQIAYAAGWEAARQAAAS